MSSSAQPCNWEQAQNRFADIPGDRGIALRQDNYAPFFLGFGREVWIERGCRFYHPDRIVLDDDVRINLDALIYGSGGVWIGRHSRIGPRCLIHSANHDISAGPTAFFERGYDELAVRIGENVLISGNVTVLPGAELGGGCFVAAGAVVTNKTYDEQLRLAGVPAQSRPLAKKEPVELAPEIALIVPRSGYWNAAARHLLVPLGLPQVTVIEENKLLPDAVHTAILIGPSNWRPPINLESVWRLVSYRNKLSDVHCPVVCSDGKKLHLPAEFVIPTVPNGEDGASSEGSNLDHLFFWFRQRLRKGAGELSQRDYREWQTTLSILRAETEPNNALIREFRSEIDRRKPDLPNGTCLWPAATTLDRPTILQEPEFLVHAAMQWRDTPKKDLPTAEQDATEATASTHLKNNLEEKLTALLRAAIPHCNNGRRLVAMALAAHLLDDFDCLAEIRQTLSQPEWQREGTAFPRASARGGGLCYSPLVLGWYYLESRRMDRSVLLQRDLGMPKGVVVPLAWHGLSTGGMFNAQKKSISRSLFENWLKIHSAPCPDGRQVLLDKNAYKPLASLVEKIWFDIFRDIQARAERPLLRLRPWPAGNRAALSLRYDVDRPISAQQIGEIVDLQRRLTKAPCATWYYFAKDNHRLKQRPQLSRHWQELGIHAERMHDAVSGLGVTHHSAPTSEYWRGEATNHQLEAIGADHCEFLAMQTVTPRPSWSPTSGETGQLAQLWTTPIHFPLEGSTRDADLSYFDRLLPQFHELLALGGHVILASHPDLNQDLLEQLLVRENLNDIWFATVGQVVNRSRRVLGSGGVKAVRSGNSQGLALCSCSHISDLSVEVWTPGSTNPNTITTQLLADQPRDINP